MDNTTIELNESIRIIFDDILCDRELDILYKRLCGYTLQSIGDSLGITKERVRQVYSKSKLRVSSNGRSISRKINKFAHDCIQQTTKEDLFVSGIIELILHQNIYGFVSGYTMPIELRDGVLKSLKEIKHTVSHSGVSKTEPFFGKNSLDLSIDMIAVHLFSSFGQCGTSVYGSGSTIYSWSPAQKRPLRNRILKMLSVCSDGYGIQAKLCYNKIVASTSGKYQLSLSYSEFIQLLIDGNKSNENSIWKIRYNQETNIIHYCGNLDEFNYEILSKGEKLIISTITENGGECSASDIATVFEVNKMARITTFVTLSKTPVVEKIKRDLYKLIKTVEIH